jgi:hypothetical protein
MLVFILSALAVCVLGAYISSKNKVNIGDGLAMSASGLILALYVLAFFRAMKLVWIAALVAIVFVLVSEISARKKSVSDKDGNVLSLVLLSMFVITVTVVGAMVSGNVFSWWDDINFWSSDAKQLFFMNGFPGKYGNVSPEFGDYPPVTSIFKWLFLQLGNGGYKEGLQFAGYFALNAVFLMPLAGRLVAAVLDNKTIKGAFRYVLAVITFVCVMALPGVFNGIIYYGTPADITMGIVYGTLLIAIYAQDQCPENFYYVRIGFFTAVLFLTKSVGIEWAVFALIFYLLVGKKSVKMIGAVVGSASVYGSWLLFCLVNRRVAKLTGAGIKMATSGTYTAPQNTADKARFFWEGLWTMPMHADRNITLDLPTGVMVIILFVVLFALVRFRLLEKKEGCKIALFMLITGLVTYGIIFLAHISIFQGEDQYLDAYAMAVSVARYGFPFAFGTLSLLIGVGLLNSRNSNMISNTGTGNDKANNTIGLAVVGIFVAFVFLAADYAGMYKHIWGYRQNANSLAQDSYNMVGDDGRIIVDTVLSDKSLWGKRVLVMRDGHTYHWVHDTYISKEASPVPLVYDAFLAESEDSAVMARKIMEKHASYLYIEDEEGISTDLFAPLMSEEKEFTPGVVYKVTEAGGTVMLE